MVVVPQIPLDGHIVSPKIECLRDIIDLSTLTQNQFILNHLGHIHLIFTHTWETHLNGLLLSLLQRIIYVVFTLIVTFHCIMFLSENRNSNFPSLTSSIISLVRLFFGSFANFPLPSLWIIFSIMFHLQWEFTCHLQGLISFDPIVHIFETLPL